MNRFDERFWVTMAVLTGVLAFDALTYLLPTKLDAQLVAAVLTVLNVQAFMNTINWWFQSSKSSADKDSTISKLVETK